MVQIPDYNAHLQGALFKLRRGFFVMRFTAEDAFDVRGTDDAIMLDVEDATRILTDHYDKIEEFYKFQGRAIEVIYAGDLLAFLGY